jgi:hypothetical protein
MIKVGNDSFLQTQFAPKASETISQRRFLAKLFICKRKIHHKGRKRFFPTVSIRSESVWNDFSEKVFVNIKMIHISILSYSLNSVRKRLKRFLREGFWVRVRVRVRVRVYLFAKQRLFWVFKIISSGAPRAPIRRSAHHNDPAWRRRYFHMIYHFFSRLW